MAFCLLPAACGLLAACAPALHFHFGEKHYVVEPRDGEIVDAETGQRIEPRDAAKAAINAALDAARRSAANGE